MASRASQPNPREKLTAFSTLISVVPRSRTLFSAVFSVTLYRDQRLMLPRVHKAGLARYANVLDHEVQEEDIQQQV